MKTILWILYCAIPADVPSSVATEAVATFATQEQCATQLAESGKTCVCNANQPLDEAEPDIGVIFDDTLLIKPVDREPGWIRSLPPQER